MEHFSKDKHQEAAVGLNHLRVLARERPNMSLNELCIQTKEITQIKAENIICFKANLILSLCAI